MEIVKNEMVITSQDIMQYINDFCQGASWQPDAITQQQFKALCQAVGYKFFNDSTAILYINNNKHCGYDYNKILYVYNIYESICNYYNKIPGIISFSYFICVDYMLFYNTIKDDTSTGASPTAGYMMQKLALNREDALKDRAIDKGGAVGVAIVGNNEYMWNDPQNRPLQVANNNNALLPDFTPKKAIKSI